MKIQGGTFGTSGSAYISKNDMLVVDGAKRGVYSNSDIVSVDTRTDKERRFGAGSFILGVIIFGVVLGSLLGIFGLLAAFVLSIGLSFYSDKSTIAEIKFNDGQNVVLDCTPRGIKKLVKFGPI